MSKSTWRSKLEHEMNKHNDSLENVVHKVSRVDNFEDALANDDYGCKTGPCFTLWTDTRVYFPCQYDGYEFVGSVARNPCNEITYHFGGG